MLNLFSLKDGKRDGQGQGNKKRATAAQVSNWLQYESNSKIFYGLPKTSAQRFKIAGPHLFKPEPFAQGGQAGKGGY